MRDFEIVAYGCSSSAGDGVSAFWESLRDGREHSRSDASRSWRRPVPFPLKTFSWQEPDSRSAKEILVSRLLGAWNEARSSLPVGTELGRLGVIFASTKGCLDDFIWDEGDLSRDPCTPVLEELVRRAGLEPARSICVSNACASSLVALLIARKWLADSEVDHVLVAAGERIGPFVAHGFQSLRALSQDRVRPFAEDRDGLQLGEAAAAILLGRGEGPLRLRAVGLDTEGFAITRPSDHGESLKRACERALAESQTCPDLIVAHGTATKINDLAEDRVFSALYAEQGRRIPVTATKWCIGHTLGASGAMDLIAAGEALRRQQVFRIASTSRIDPQLSAAYLYSGGAEGSVDEPARTNNVLITSLGFGGTHAAVVLGRDAREAASL